MRKRIVWPVILLLALVLCACGGKSFFSADDVEMLLDAGAFGDSDMEELDDDILLMLYGIDEETVLKCDGYLAANTSVSADEVALFVMQDEEAAEAAVEACRKRLNAQLDMCRTYCPDAVPRLEHAYLRRLDNTVLLAVGDSAFIAELMKG